MILKIYRYDHSDQCWENPCTLKDLVYIKVSPDLPKLKQVGTYEFREYEDSHPSNEPKAIIINGEAKIVWEPTEEQKRAYFDWCQIGEDHSWIVDTFYRTIDRPIYGYEINTLEELEQILRFFEEIATGGDEIRIKN